MTTHRVLRSLLSSTVLSASLLGIGTVQAETLLKVIPHADLKNVDPIWTTAYITRNHGYMVYDTLFAMNDLERGITVNVGTIDGGLRPNVIAPSSQAVVDVRVASQEDAERIGQTILNLRPAIAGTSLKVEGGFGRPAMERTPANRSLWRLACRLGADLGLQLEEALAGGGSDGNFTSQYTATLDGLGAVGDGAHARHEHLRLGPTLERTALLALLLLAPALSPSGPRP